GDTGAHPYVGGAPGAAEARPPAQAPACGLRIAMHLLRRRSEEGGAECLGIFPADVTRLPSGSGLKVPHMGWNSVDFGDNPLFDGLESGTYFYYVHSYAPQICPATIATTTHGTEFGAALRSGNFYGTQFHPEKSGAAGEKLLANFLRL
ncbi:MAG: imidazole glycerol phosphate synthase subunit HisH, partial [Rikenellaceae bacterium]|nr:imidazole glycerol phosphate synthase subunit HisH [Rikenellaceae bacterium]